MSLRSAVSTVRGQHAERSVTLAGRREVRHWDTEHWRKRHKAREKLNVRGRSPWRSYCGWESGKHHPARVLRQPLNHWFKGEASFGMEWEHSVRHSKRRDHQRSNGPVLSGKKGN